MKETHKSCFHTALKESYTSKGARPHCRQPCSHDSCRRGQGPSCLVAFLTRWHQNKWLGQGCQTVADRNFKAEHECSLNRWVLPLFLHRIRQTADACHVCCCCCHRRWLSLKKGMPETCAFKCKVLHTHLVLPLCALCLSRCFNSVSSQYLVVLLASIFNLRIWNTDSNISIMGASTSKGIGEAKHVAASHEIQTHVAHTARAGHTLWVPLGRAGRAQAHHQPA